MKGISQKLSPDDILSATNQGYDIYRYYIGNRIGRQMKRPWGKDDKPSFGVFMYNNTYCWKDMATEESGNALTFVEKMFGLSFEKALQKIMHDFGLGANPVNTSPVVWSTPSVDETEYVFMSFTGMRFKKKHHEFWNIVEVDEAWCNKYECWAVKDAVVSNPFTKKRQRVAIGKDEIVFAYYAPEEEGVKLYFPEREKGNKFRTNISYNYLWNYSNIISCDKLIIQKSNKDMIVTAMLFPCIINTQSEAVKIFNKDTVAIINNTTLQPWIWYGSDWDGVKKCKEITDTNKWKYINTPKQYLPDVNDVYGMVRMHNLQEMGTGMKELEKFMKLKKLL